MIEEIKIEDPNENEANERRIWTKDEDDAIRNLVEKFGTKSWSVISDHIISDYGITGRSGKQCRERWHNHLGNFTFLIIYFIFF